MQLIGKEYAVCTGFKGAEPVPDLNDGAQIRLFMNDGTVLNIHCFSAVYGINEDSYPTSDALRRLETLWMDKYRGEPPEPEGGKVG